MRILTSTLLAAALMIAAPAYAHDRHSRGGHHFAHGHHKPHHKLHRQQHFRHHPPARFSRTEVHNYYYDYGYGVPAASVPPGVHIVLPNIFLPF
ncbi:MAG: hypothetical protein OEZ08_03145 [Betaproteobacteria bacterium]|nr:hypothetical protein [Betaproteobacteria bacterium]